MTELEELQQALSILRKYDMPISPILEYAFKEKEEQFMCASSVPIRNRLIAEPIFEPQGAKTLDNYRNKFACLSVGVANGKKLPHKAILLIAIMCEIEKGNIVENRIPLDNSISKAFSACWNEYLGSLKVPSVWTPFWYMKSEPFWHFKAIESEDVLAALLNFAGHPSIGQMRKVIKYAYFDEELFELLAKKNERSQLLHGLLNYCKV